MREIIVELLGEYTPVTQENGDIIGGLASLDYTWLVGAACFCIMLVGTLCILRTMFKGIFKG